MASYQSVAVSDGTEQQFDAPGTPVHTDQVPLQKEMRKGKKERFCKVGSDTWSWEIFACTIAILTVLATAFVLQYHNGHPAPVVLKFNITLGSVLSILATIIKSALYMPLASGLSQIMWSKFQQGPRPLNDIALYDKASRGVIGGIRLLWRRRGRQVPQSEGSQGC